MFFIINPISPLLKPCIKITQKNKNTAYKFISCDRNYVHTYNKEYSHMLIHLRSNELYFTMKLFLFFVACLIFNFFRYTCITGKQIMINNNICFFLTFRLLLSVCCLFVNSKWVWTILHISVFLHILKELLLPPLTQRANVNVFGFQNIFAPFHIYFWYFIYLFTQEMFPIFQIKLYFDT